MTMNRRQAMVALWGGLSVLGARNAQAAPPTAHYAPGFGTHDLYALVGRSTRLSVLAGRITRSQAQRTLNVLTDEAMATLSPSAQEAHQHFTALGTALSASPVQASAQAALQAYGAFLQASTTFTPQDRAALIRLARTTRAAVVSIDQLTTDLLPHLGHPMARLLLVTSQLQRQSQHLAARFLLLRTGISDADEAMHLQQGREAFTRQMGELQTAALQTPRTREQWPLLASQWVFMNAALAQTSSDPKAMETTCTTSERMLEVLDQLYPEYEAAMRQSG